MRDYLHLPPEVKSLLTQRFDQVITVLLFQIVPATLKPKRTESARPRAAAATRPEASKLSEDRTAYRRSAPAGGDKKADVGAGANPNLEFVRWLKIL